MDEREAFEQLVDRYGLLRVRHLLGALRVLALYDERELLRRRWMSRTALALRRRDLHLAGVPWPSPVGAGDQAAEG